MKIWLIRCCCLLLLSGVFAAVSGCSSKPSGPETFPVTGVVTVNGKPAERMAVLFHHQDAALSSSYRYPTGVTNAEGVFQLSSMGDNDGAAAGQYAVTFTWLSSADLDAVDMLNGELAKPESSTFKVQVPLPDTDPLKLDLTFPEEKLMRSRSGGSPAGAD